MIIVISVIRVIIIFGTHFFSALHIALLLIMPVRVRVCVWRGEIVAKRGILAQKRVQDYCLNISVQI